MKNLPILFGYNISGIGNSSIPLELVTHWNQMGQRSVLYAPSTDSLVGHHAWLKPALRGLRKKLVYNFYDHKTPRDLAESYMLQSETGNPVAYLWAGLSPGVFESLHKRGCRIILERINCHQATARKILNKAYWELGMMPAHAITDTTIADEKYKLEMSDAIFCPSPRVYESMIENGVPAGKLISTSYGWSPRRFPGHGEKTESGPRRVRFLFAGRLCVRKGIPLLVKAWEEAGVDGDLTLCGTVDPDIRRMYPGFFEREEVNHVDFTRDIGRYYADADVFLFPSLEEGGPMVTYEAMAHGAVPLVSDMGAGAIVEHRKNGLVLEHDSTAWATAIQAIASNHEKRMALGVAAARRAENFTWEIVAAQRFQLLSSRYPDLLPSHGWN